MNANQARQRIHEAVQAVLDEGEIAVGWTLTVDVAQGGGRYLAHRAGGGHDGTDPPSVWAALGMLEAGVHVAKEQLGACSRDIEDEP